MVAQPKTACAASRALAKPRYSPRDDSVSRKAWALHHEGVTAARAREAERLARRATGAAVVRERDRAAEHRERGARDVREEAALRGRAAERGVRVDREQREREEQRVEHEPVDRNDVSCKDLVT